MDYNNIDLNRPAERNANILEALNFETLLLEISCNLPVINEKTIREQFEIDLTQRINDAREILEANLQNILTEAIKTQKIQ